MVSATGNIDFIIFTEDRFPVGDQELAAVQNSGNTDIINDRSAGNIPQAHTKQLGGTADPDDRHAGIRMTKQNFFEDRFIVKYFVNLTNGRFRGGKGSPYPEILRCDPVGLRNTVRTEQAADRPFYTESGGELARKNIGCFVSTYSNECIGSFDPGFLQNRNIGTAAADALNIKPFAQTFQFFVIAIQNYHVIILLTKSLCKQASQFSGSNNDRFHLHAPLSVSESIR